MSAASRSAAIGKILILSALSHSRTTRLGLAAKRAKAVGGTSPVRHRRAGGYANGLQARDHVGQHGVFATMKMTGVPGIGFSPLGHRR
jgi:hypothetical protein